MTSAMTRLAKAVPLIILCCLISASVSAQIGGVGWAAKSLKFHVQSPTNVPQSQRYFVNNGLYHMLVYSNDGAFSIGNTTKPRTEQRFDPDYTNGIIHYQATMMTTTNSSGVCLFQIHTGDAQSTAFGSTTFMLFWFSSNHGSVHKYSGTTLVTNLSGKWFTVNCDHNLNSRIITVWVNGDEVWQQLDNGAGDFYFKDGVYAQNNGSYEMDNYVTNVLIWTNLTTAQFSGLYEIKNSHSGLAINVRGAATTNKAPIIQWPFNGSANSLWYFVPVTNGYYRIINVNSCAALAVQNSSVANGALIVQSPPPANGSADWYPGQNSDGSYTLTNRYSRGILDVGESSLSKDVQLVQTNANGNSSQKWLFIPYGNVVSDSTTIAPLSTVSTNSHELRMELPGVPGASYVLLMTTNLSSPHWQPVATNTADAWGNCSFTDTSGATHPARFLRATLQ